MQILIDVSYGEGKIDSPRVAALAEYAMRYLEVPENAEVSITFIDNEEMAALNLQYRGLEGPTDVLSFECDNLEDEFCDSDFGIAAGCEGLSSAQKIYSLGDIIIAPEVADKQAQEFGNSFENEIDLLIVHGILHLNGYDHIEDTDAELMEAYQQKILHGWRESGL